MLIILLLIPIFERMSKQNDKKLTEQEVKALKAKKEKSVKTQEIITK